MMKKVIKKRSSHNLLHYLFMVIYLEVINIIWILVGLAGAMSGYVLFSFTQLSFWRMALGMPLGLIGATVFVFKLYEFVLVIFNSSRIKAICKFCTGSVDYE